MTFPGENVTFDLQEQVAAADAAGAPVATWVTRRSGVAASRQPHRPKLHGEEYAEWGQTTQHKVLDYLVGRLLPELPKGDSNGWRVAESSGRTAKVVSSEEYEATGGVAAYCILRCEQVDA